MKLLVAEDDRATLTRMEALALEWGYQCITATNGAEALRLFELEHPDLVLTDWLMPEMDGLDLLRAIRKTDGKRARAYVIMLTTRGETPDLVRGMEAGADDFVRKPFEKEELRVRLRAGERLIEQQQILEKKNEDLVMAYLKIHFAHLRMKRELHAASQIQNAFLPKEMPKTPKANFAWRHEACEELSGDTLNLIPFDASRVGMYVADVCGHGISSALLSVHLNRLLSEPEGKEGVLLRAASDNGDDWMPEMPAEVAHRLNRIFPCDLDRVQYFNMLYGVLDLENRLFHYTSAGQCGPILISHGKSWIRKATPPAVGLVSDATFVEQKLKLHPGDRLYLYTDGLYEIANSSGQELGEDRLAEWLKEQRNAPLEEGLNRVLAQARDWGGGQPLKDDLSLLGVEIAA